jgi:hypothetical protein
MDWTTDPRSGTSFRPWRRHPAFERPIVCCWRFNRRRILLGAVQIERFPMRRFRVLKISFCRAAVTIPGRKLEPANAGRS